MQNKAAREVGSVRAEQVVWAWSERLGASAGRERGHKAGAGSVCRASPRSRAAVTSVGRL